MSLMGERVLVSIPTIGDREGILLNGKKAKKGKVQSYTVRFKNGDVRTYRGDEITFTGNQAEMDEYIQEGDVLFTKATLGVCRYIGPDIPGYNDMAICVEAYDPQLDNPGNIDYPGLLPSANLNSEKSYTILGGKKEIKKVVPPEDILRMLSRIKDKYMELYQNPRFRDQPAGQPAEPTPTYEATFNPTKLGIKADWNIGQINYLEPDGQAATLGVCKGWQIIKVNGDSYSETLLDEALSGGQPFVMTFDTKGIPPAAGKAEARNAVVGLAQQAKAEVGDDSAPQGVSANEIEELENLRSENQGLKEENATLKEELAAKENELGIIRHKNEELLQDSKNLNHARLKVEQLRNSRKAFSEQVRKLENEKADLQKQLSEKIQAHSHVSEELRRLEEENHRLQKKYKKVKRRASKTGINRPSTMKIMRNSSAMGDAAPTQEDEDDNSVLHAEPQQPTGQAADELADLKEKDGMRTDSLSSPEKKDDGTKTKSRRGWFGRGT